MSDERMTTIEKEPQYRAIYLGQLKDFGLGNPDGITSDLEGANDEEIKAFGEEMLAKLEYPTNLNKCKCFDGRHRKGNADGSPEDVSLHRAGASSGNLSSALNGQAEVAESFTAATSVKEMVNTVNEAVLKGAGFEPCAHRDGCAAANGVVDHQRAISTEPQIMLTVEALMSTPQFSQYTETSYDADLGKQVAKNAAGTADILQAAGWNGTTFVERIALDKPANVEELIVDPNAKHHGHKEKAIIFVLGDKVLDEPDVFAYNVKSSVMVAKALQGSRGHEGYTQVLTSEIATHLSIGNALASPNTPVFIYESY